MRRSLLLRLLTLSLSVALAAVIATALLATYDAGEQLQGELESSAGLLETDQQISGSLATHATDHTSWAGVEPVVRRLADDTGRRVALTTPDGTLIADSETGIGGRPPELPPVPAATIDAASPGISGTATWVGVTRTQSLNVAAGGGAFTVTTTGAGGHYWRLTAAERSQRLTLARQAAGCLRKKGYKPELIDDPNTAPDVWQKQDIVNPEGQPVIGDHSGEPNWESCVPKGLRAPSNLSMQINRDEIARSTSCLKRANVAYQLIASRVAGLTEVAPKPRTTNPPEAFGKCLEEARIAALRPHVAPPAKLYLGSSDRFDVFTPQGLLRTGATALGVLLIAALVSVLAGRRLVHPIVALTGAAQRMATGDRATRVPVSGTDEVARLGHAFNAMAESIEKNEQQRRVMVSDVAHELRTPLSNIRGYLEASEDGVVPLDRKLVRSLLEEANLLERLVSDLQELALADAGMLRIHPEQRDLTEIAQQAVAAHRAQAEVAGVSLGLFAPEPAVATVDPARIRQALGNLVANAVKFTPPGGTVGVSVRSSEGGIELSVADTGQGIAAEHLPHLFDRFYRADPSRSRATGGSGLGLAITKHLVEAHGGTVQVTSTPAQGSVFTIHLPG